MNGQAQVLVVGAGPTGLMMASELTRLGVSCRVIDKAPGPSQFSKALGIQARTLELFERMGLASSVVAAGTKLHGINVYSEGKRIVHLNFDQIASAYNYVLVLPQSETERFLTDYLAGLGVSVERNAGFLRLTQRPDGIDAVVRHERRGVEEQLRVPWVIGCDGAHSSVRHLLGISFAGRAFEELFFLADVRLEASVPDDEITVHLRHGDIVGFFPLPGDHRFRIVVERPPQEGAVAEPTLDEFQQAVASCHLGPVRMSDPTWMSRFRISQRRVAHYRQGGAFLAGDAAHIHSPLGAQGMNTGIQDACNLAWKLALVVQGRARPEILDSYQQERQPLGEKLLRATGALSKIILWRNPVAETVRDRIAAILTSWGPVQDMLRSSLSELAVNYRDSPLVQEHSDPGLAARLAGWLHLEARPRAGDGARDARVIRAENGAPVRAFELLSGLRHVALLFVARHPSAEDAQRRREVLHLLRQGYGDLIDAYLIVPDAQAPPVDAEGATVLRAPDGALHREHGAEEEVLYLVRPDGYIGYRSQPPEAGPLSAYLRAIFLPGPG